VKRVFIFFIIILISLSNIGFTSAALLIYNNTENTHDQTKSFLELTNSGILSNAIETLNNYTKSQLKSTDSELTIDNEAKSKNFDSKGKISKQVSYDAGTQMDDYTKPNYLNRTFTRSTPFGTITTGIISSNLDNFDIDQRFSGVIINNGDSNWDITYIKNLNLE
jgi:hypothetical protein